MNRYRVARGPVSPPASLNHGRIERLETGQVLTSEETPWTRQCLRDGRLAPADAETSAEPTDKRKKGKPA